MPKYSKVSRLVNIPGIGVDKMGNAADNAHDPEILRLENLDTDISPPPLALEVTKRSVERDENNSYLPFLGQQSLRQAATNRVNKVCKGNYDWRTECIISAGGMSGILNCLLALVEPGDEVIVTDPVYAGIINRIYLSGGTPVFVNLIPSPTGWSLDLEAFKKAITPKTKLIVISPGMPSGHILTEEEWKVVTDVTIANDLWLLYDAAMEKILYDGRKVIHPASFKGMRERTITVGAASKELRMIGWRIGWIVAPEQIMNDIGLVSISNVVCQTGISMEGVAAGLENNDLDHALTIWEERRNTLISEMKSLPIIPPHGGWSLLLDTQKLGFTPQQASERLFKMGKIAATPMNGWGKQAEKYLRFVFSNEPKERLIGLKERIEKSLR